LQYGTMKVNAESEYEKEVGEMINRFQR
jgi:hypothetical protein